MKKMLIFLVSVICAGYVSGASNEPPVVIFEGTGVTLGHVYDPSRDMYFVPAVNLPPEVKELHRKGITGRGVIVAIIDTGLLSRHPLIKNALLRSVDFTGEGAEDLNGHGTVVALIYLASAPDSAILNIKALDRNGKGTVSNLIKAIRRAAQEGARVINLSLGVYLACRGVREYGEESSKDHDSCERTELCRAVTAVSRSVVISAAVGNIAGLTACPACCRSALAVGATTKEGKIAPYSGANPDVVAPGEVQMVPYVPKD